MRRRIDHLDTGRCALLPQIRTRNTCSRADAWGALFAAQALVESANLAQVSERNQGKLERVRKGLLFAMRHAEVPAQDRLPKPAVSWLS